MRDTLPVTCNPNKYEGKQANLTLMELESPKHSKIEA